MLVSWLVEFFAGNPHLIPIPPPSSIKSENSQLNAFLHCPYLPLRAVLSIEELPWKEISGRQTMGKSWPCHSHQGGYI